MFDSRFIPKEKKKIPFWLQVNPFSTLDDVLINE